MMLLVGYFLGVATGIAGTVSARIVYGVCTGEIVLSRIIFRNEANSEHFPAEGGIVLGDRI